MAVTEWKAVYGRIEARDRIPARARLGGTLMQLDVTEGDQVAAGQPLARIVDGKLDFRLAALDAQLQVLDSQLTNARTELTRGEELLKRGVTTVQRLDGLRTQVDVLTNRIDATRAERRVIEQQAAEGDILAPLTGRVLDVPVSVGAVILPGEVVAMIGGGGFYLRLAVPERHAAALGEGDLIEIEESGGARQGRLARLYPEIENGRVVADVEVAGLSDVFVGKRVLVRLPVAERSALMVPAAAVHSRAGLDFVQLDGDGAQQQRTVLPGRRVTIDGIEMIEILAGLSAGDTVVLDDE
ncbi:efflux RND transporter periplasmic adaptor subunit [Sedimentitalea sp. HM32M-2]|uniref:efflux RND transporter periplasmic adaptor subunit n=1 Tax=Sedimentitalea sp. HM32M-2 TaxID=3351566 RepID=UPI003636A6C5